MNYDPRIARAFDAVLDRAKIDQSTLALDGLVLSVSIDGKRYSCTLAAAPTVESIRLAIAEMLLEHCAFEAARAVIAEDRLAAPYDAADLEQGRAILFSTIRDVMSTERATACIEAIRALVDAEVDTALAAHGVRTS